MKKIKILGLNLDYKDILALLFLIIGILLNSLIGLIMIFLSIALANIQLNKNKNTLNNFIYVIGIIYFIVILILSILYFLGFFYFKYLLIQ